MVKRILLSVACLFTCFMVYCNIRGSMVKDDQQVVPLCHLGNDSRLQRVSGNNVTNQLRDNVSYSF